MALVLTLTAVLGGVFFSVPSQAADTSSLGQIVDYFQANDSTFKLDAATSRFYLLEEPTGELLQTVQLSQRQFAEDGFYIEVTDPETLEVTKEPLPIVWFAEPSMVRSGDILIKMVDDDANIGAEGYKLEVTNYATVIAEDVDGLLYGLNMLQKHLRAAGSAEIKGFTTYDTPDTKERTAQLDCARKYLTKDYICNFIKEMSWMGYNALQLHVSEDGGFRADFWDSAYYVEDEFEPENDFTWLCGSKTQSWTHDSTLTGVDYRVDPDAGKYLYAEDLIDIINTCKEYHIEVIPSFDSPGHMDYLTWKFEQNYRSNTSYSFTYNGTTYKASDTYGCINYVGMTGATYPDWPEYTAMDIRDNTTRGKMSQAFVFSIYKDMADFFRYYAGSTKFNIGTDEVNLTNSQVSADAWSYDLFPGYVNELNALLKAKGYKVRMFNDFINEDNVDEFDSDIEILYWNSPFNSITGTAGAYDEPSVSAFVNDDRILYNCINQHTYYVLRINDSQGDARSKTCYQWEFYGATEDAIYNDWSPNNIRKKGKYTEPDAIVPDAQLGGAYFLTWHDYAAVNTETEVWNGVYDAAKKTGEFYSLRWRMWSNITKMWNWDVNKTLSFDNFKTIRDSLGDFPGLQDDTFAHASYAKAAPLSVAATAPIALADHTALTEALATKIEQGEYSDQTYAAYLQAYEAAKKTNARNDATAQELGEALASLKLAIKNLKIRTNAFTVEYKTVINGSTILIDSKVYEVHYAETDFNIFVDSMIGYKFLRVEGPEGATFAFTPTDSGDGSGYLSGTASSDMVFTVWYENATDLSRLKSLVAEGITEQGQFTDASWAVYSQALAEASKFTLTPGTRQSDVDKLVKALEEARNGLVIPCDETFIKVELVFDGIKYGEQVGLHVYTSPDVPTLNITNKQTGQRVEPDLLTGQVQTLDDGSVVKYWLVFFPADFSGETIFIISYNLTYVEI